mmetsp:Transcript_16074/g.22186  ORF Transcript_16074/g.22186 Transcript_16074/m.22186 type:complete len:613 (-) Transcript_16074:190-2028(-)|eukprot:CAMPEP_0196583250 /NCGR_PEP_ID=MMETSP1081-20130531/42681_1 /TAXON_ID=36882 /ORGANISM="Pyramimonas amylifera, Strain CCMP720" /LENGTH=612 /DNA_ID=CAMNT_0041904071 /DNA_START=394 /DNA_END=2232 /DNA_ORIENTATION=+
MSSEHISGQTFGETYGKIADQKDKVTADEIDTVWKAAAYGDTDKLKEMLEADVSRVNQPDQSGYLPLQWASLNNRVAAMTLLFEWGAEADASEPGGQTALHWAATRGSLPAVELLLRSGASAGKEDLRGYTICHVAAQYGQTALLHHLALKWDVEMDTRDHDGRTPLHWAAYKGFGDSIRLLLCLGAQVLLPDKEGCTALHWAAIKGNHEACTLLVMGGAQEALGMSDSTGSTPSQLASQKGHYMCSEWLAREQADRAPKVGLLRGLPRGMKHLAPLLWAVILGLLGMFLRFIPLSSSSSSASICAWVVVLSSLLGCAFLLRAGTRDPGFMCCGDSQQGKSEELDSKRAAAQSLDSPALWDGHWNTLCMQCRRVRPPRSKYCRVSQRCVSRFDHYCPWIGNAVGENNHRDFVLFLVLETVAMLVALITAIHYLASLNSTIKELVDTHPGALAFALCDGVVMISVTMLTCAQLGQVFQNITTNEFINQHRYKYLQAHDGSFFNPYDKGCLPNTVEFFLGPEMVEKLSAIEAPPAQRVEERVSMINHGSSSHSSYNRYAPPSGRACAFLAAIGVCCQSSSLPRSRGHSHSHGHSHKGCCKKEKPEQVKDIEDAL